MSEDLSIIKVPQIDANEDKATFIKWNFMNGDKVNEGEIIGSLETSKATFDIISDYDGYILQLVNIGDEVLFDDELALIGPDKNKLKKEKIKFDNKKKLKSEKKVNEKNITKKGEILADKLNININELSISGIIKENDVRNYAYELGVLKIKNEDLNKEFCEIIDLIGNTKKASEMMLESYTKIPHSYIERKVDLTDLEKRINKILKKKKKLITILSVLIAALGRTLEKNKTFNSYRKQNKINVYKNVNIGVVIEHEGKITIPIIKNANQLNPDIIVKELMRMRKSILINKPDIKDLKGGTFTVSAMDHTEVTRFVPIIHPKQSGVLAFPKIQIRKVYGNKDGIVEKKFSNIGLSFDHSFINAGQANRFITDLVNEISILCKGIN